MNKAHATADAVYLEMSCSYWLTLSMMVFGVAEAQNINGHRIMDIREKLTLDTIGGKMKNALLYTQTYAWYQAAVPLEPGEVAVLLKVIRWYEDTLVKNISLIETLGEKELMIRYEKLTQITRAIQTAPAVNSDQRNR